ncbi:MAG: hypothetical protein SNJ75_15540, partial [Gemmataceae bacterium]
SCMSMTSSPVSVCDIRVACMIGPPRLLVPLGRCYVCERRSASGNSSVGGCSLACWQQSAPRAVGESLAWVGLVDSRGLQNALDPLGLVDVSAVGATLGVAEGFPPMGRGEVWSCVRCLLG